MKTVVTCLLFVLFSLGFAKKLDFTLADLGRHIKNGELLMSAPASLQTRLLLHQNFYSYTLPDYPFINHHWGTGIIFYLVEKWAGFGGLSLFYLGLGCLTFGVYFRLAQRVGSFGSASAAALLLLPLLTQRTEIRPEMFSYLFSGIFLDILWMYRDNLCGVRSLAWLPALQLIWVNLHIGFIFGIFFIGLFACEELLQLRHTHDRSRAKALWLTLALCGVATLLNPSGIAGALYPLNILREYGYLVKENQSVLFLERLGMGNVIFTLLKISFALLAASFVLIYRQNREKFSWCLGAGCTALGVLAFLSIRHIPSYGFLALPVLSLHGSEIYAQRGKIFSPFWLRSTSALLVCVLVLSFAVQLQLQSPLGGTPGFGLAPGVDAAADFYKRFNLRGPIFNNYDIGGYLIYHLYPQEKVFVDNRPEAYPVGFFQNIYKPIQEDDMAWQKINQLQPFNVIFFSHRDLTPWGQKFLVRRIQDPEWAPVFADNYAIIFLRNNTQNKSLIDALRIPSERFRVSKG